MQASSDKHTAYVVRNTATYVMDFLTILMEFTFVIIATNH